MHARRQTLDQVFALRIGVGLGAAGCHQQVGDGLVVACIQHLPGDAPGDRLVGSVRPTADNIADRAGGACLVDAVAHSRPVGKVLGDADTACLAFITVGDRGADREGQAHGVRARRHGNRQPGCRVDGRHGDGLGVQR